jgi:hypothetical protein
MRGSMLLLAVALAAGCASSTAPPPDAAPAEEAPSHGAAGQAASLALIAKDCVEGGGHTSYRFQPGGRYLPEPWKEADVSDDLGHPLVGSEGRVGDTPSWGIYHASVRCASYALDGKEGKDLFYGFVAIRVEPPPFDDGTAKIHYLAMMISASNPDVQEALHAAGFHASKGSGVAETVGSTFHQVLRDEHHGDFESRFVSKEAGPMPPGPVRLWMLTKGDDGKFHPRSLDWTNEGGAHIVAEGVGTISHTGTNDHAPLPGVAANANGLAYAGYARTITLGPAPDVALDKQWEHTGLV